MLSSRFGHLYIAVELLDKGANMFPTSNNGCTAFALACEEGHLDIVKELFGRSLGNPDYLRKPGNPN